ncbi:MAG: efflux RND transporter periplasmic adaptor subunit [Legionellales bacterium]|nr:efflux RND transporter periplasmic adaptor subunit [Legionellales bacterium]
MKLLSRRLVLILSLIILLILVGIFFYWHKHRQHSWVPVKRGPMVTAIYGLGTVTSKHIYHLKLGITTTVKKLYVVEGDDVRKGQALVEFTDSPLVRANFAGTITSLPLHENETVYPQTEILTLMNLNEAYILVSLEQEAAVKIHKGQAVKVSFDGLDNQTFQGIVESVYPNQQEFYVRIKVDNLPKNILPEMSSDVAIILNTTPSAQLIPVNAIQNDTVTIKRHHKIIKEKIKIGIINNNQAQVISNNLQDSDHVLVMP